MTNNLDTIEHHAWDSQKDGPHLLITGGIHGNEVCGTKAIYWLKDQIDAGLIKINNGAVTILPICNPRAHEANTRYFERDLNRHFYPKADPVDYEDRICNIVTDYFEDADLLLDLHSYHTEGDPFIFFRPDNKKDLEFASMLGVSTSFSGFADAYAKAGVVKSKEESMGTRDYMVEINKHGVTMECGFHNNPKSIEIAKGAILGALHHTAMADIDDSLKYLIPENRSMKEGNLFNMSEVFYKEKEGKLEDIQHLQQIKKGDLLAHYNDKSKIVAPYNSYVVFPNKEVKTGNEWFYLAKKFS